MLDMTQNSGNANSHPTIKDVAALAQVAPKTVSRVINEEPYVSSTTKERVLSAIKELHYRPDVHAADLKRGKSSSRTLGVLLGARPNPFSSSVHWSIDSVAVQHSSLVLASALTGNQDRDSKTVDEMLSRRIDGLILVTAASSQDYLIPEMRRGLAVVFADSTSMGLPSDTVMSDNYAGAINGTRALLSIGHRNMAYLGAKKNVYTVSQRRKGFLAAVKESSLPMGNIDLVDDMDECKAYTVTCRLIDRARTKRPTAIFAGQNLIARGVIRALRTRGLEKSIAIISFDDADMFDMLDPGITVIKQNPENIGRIAANMAFERINGLTADPRHILLPTELIPRGSGEIPPSQ